MTLKRIYPLLLVVLVFQSCTEKIDFDLNNSEFKRVVVEGLITDQQKAHEVKLSYTTSYYDNEPTEMVTGAAVSITDGSQTWSLTEQPSNSGLYYTNDNVAGTVGKTHTLFISHDGNDYEASDYLNPVAELDSIGYFFEEIDVDEDEDPYYVITLSTTETAETEDYYRWRKLVNDVTRNDSLEYYAFSDDSWFNGTTLIELEFFEDDEIEVGDTITIEQLSITEQANDVFIALHLETLWRGGLFDSAPANVQSNVSNGALGFFGASAVSSKTIIIEE